MPDCALVRRSERCSYFVERPSEMPLRAKASRSSISISALTLRSSAAARTEMVGDHQHHRDGAQAVDIIAMRGRR